MSELALLVDEHRRRPVHRGLVPDGPAPTTAAGAGRAAPAQAQATVHNPLCGDEVTVQVTPDGGIRWDALGCALSSASASLLAERLEELEEDGLAPAELLAALGRLAAPPRDPGPREGDEDVLGALAALADVRRSPARLRCASLAWTAWRTALDAARPADAGPQRETYPVQEAARA